MAIRRTSWMTSVGIAGLLIVAGCGSSHDQTTKPTGSSEQPGSIVPTTGADTTATATTAAPTAALPSSPPQTVSSLDLAQVVLPSGEIVRLVERTNPVMFCVVKVTAAKTQCLGMPPTTPTAGPVPQLTAGHPLVGMFVYVVNADFPASVTVRDAAGPTLISARSSDGRYLVIADPNVSPSAGPSTSVPARSFEVVADGRVVTVLAIPAYNAPGTTPTDPRIALLACLRGHGLEIPDPGTVPGASSTPGTAYPPAIAQAAWQDCRSQYPSQTPDSMAFLDCMAGEGWLQAVLSFPVDDSNAHTAATSKCKALQPSMSVVVACLRAQGLDVTDPTSAPRSRPAPQQFPTADATAAWAACRSAYANASNASVSQLAYYDCMAGKGWIVVNVTGPPHESFVYDEAAYQTAGSGCRG